MKITKKWYYLNVSAIIISKLVKKLTKAFKQQGILNTNQIILHFLINYDESLQPIWLNNCLNQKIILHNWHFAFARLGSLYILCKWPQLQTIVTLSGLADAQTTGTFFRLYGARILSIVLTLRSSNFKHHLPSLAKRPESVAKLSQNASHVGRNSCWSPCI